MLHVHCGTSSAEALRKSGAPGEVIEWSDVLWEGRLDASVPPEQWRRIRAKVLSERTYGQLAEGDVLGWLTEQDKRLLRYSAHDETVLWFDACMYDQLILIRQLDWFSRQPTPPAALSLISIGSFPGVERFSGLGDLTPDQLRSLLEGRCRVTADQIACAREYWAAVCGDDPEAVARVVGHGDSPLQFAADALRRLLEELPWRSNGLSRLQNEVLSAVSEGQHRLIEIFLHASRSEQRPFFGDSTLYAVIADLATAPEPALNVSGPGELPLWNPPSNLKAWEIEMTPLGQELGGGHEDWVVHNGIDKWIGGIHLKSGSPLWRYDSVVQSPVLAE